MFDCCYLTVSTVSDFLRFLSLHMPLAVCSVAMLVIYAPGFELNENISVWCASGHIFGISPVIMNDLELWLNCIIVCD